MEQAASKTRSNAANEAMEAATQARERPEEARLLCQQKCLEAAETETMFNGAIQHTLEKAEALEKHGKTVTMRAVVGDHGGRLLQDAPRHQE